MIVIPMKNTSANMAKNRIYDEFIELIKTYYKTYPDINIVDFNKLIKEIGAMVEFENKSERSYVLVRV